VRLLIVRPQPGADATAKRIREAGFEPIVMPLFAIEPLPFPSVSADDYDAVLLTSGNAVRAAGDHMLQLGSLPIYVVGAATANALAKLSLDPEFVGAEGVTSVILKAQGRGHRKLLWLTGEDFSEPDLPATMELDIRFVYRSAALPVPDDFKEAVARADAIMLHSSRAASHFAGICDNSGLGRNAITITTFSQNIADSAGNGWADIIVSPAPNDAALLPELQRRFTIATRDP
jgi:uroporphyrinogen-III synthase